MYQVNLESIVTNYTDRYKMAIRTLLLNKSKEGLPLLPTILEIYPEKLNKTRFEPAIRVGLMLLDDPKAIKSLYTEVINELKKYNSKEDLEKQIALRIRDIASASDYINRNETDAWLKFLNNLPVLN